MNTDKWHLYNTGNHISDVYSQPSSLLLSNHFMQNKYNILKVLSHTFENHRKPKVLIKIPVNFPDNMYVSDISLGNVICIFLKICSLWHIKRIWQNSKISMLCGKSTTTLCTVMYAVRIKLVVVVIKDAYISSKLTDLLPVQLDIHKKDRVKGSTEKAKCVYQKRLVFWAAKK